MSRTNIVVNQPITITFQLIKNGQPFDALNVIKVDLYNSYINAQNETNLLQTTSVITRIGVGLYQYSFDPISEPGNYFDKIFINTAPLEQTFVKINEFFISKFTEDESVIIDDLSMQKIKSVIGYPRIDKIVFDDEEIKNLVIQDIMRKYFNKFPKTVQTQTPVAEFIDVPFLDSHTFGICNIQVVGKGGQGGTSDNFWDIVRWQIYTGWSMTGQYGITRFNPNGLNDTWFNRSNQLNTVQNKLTTQDVRVDTANRIVHVYAGVSSQVLITWAKYSFDFADIRREWYPDVITLCQGKLMDLTGKMVGLLDDTDISIRFNPDALKSDGAALTQEVMQRWDQIPGSPLVAYRST